MQITAANDTAIALDLGAGSDYEKLTTDANSAGGVVEDVVLRGAKTGLRVAVTQARPSYKHFHDRGSLSF